MKKIKAKKCLFVLLGILAIASIFTLIYFKYMPLNKPNIILIVIDSLRPDHLSCYGYKRKTSPNIDKLAKEGIIFTQAIAAGGWTPPSVSSILTGTYSFLHRITKWEDSRNPSISTLPQLLKSKNIKSILFSDHAPLGTLDIKDGFGSIYIGDQKKIDGQQLTLKAINWIKKNKDNPFFMYLHYHGSHYPYRPPEPYKSMYLCDEFRIKKEIPISETEDKNSMYPSTGEIRYIVREYDISDVSYYIAQYDGTISYMDIQIGLLMDNLKQSGLLKDTLIIFTADHGEMLGEHNFYFSHAVLYENDIRVPLIIRFPKLFPKGQIISQQISLIDIVPTILETMKINAPSYLQGKSLSSIFKKNEPNLHPYVYTSHYKWVSIRSKDWKLIRVNEGSSYELYNLVQDPQEQNNLVNERENKFKELKKVLEAYEKEFVSSNEGKIKPLTDEQKEILRSLGYSQ